MTVVLIYELSCEMEQRRFVCSDFLNSVSRGVMEEAVFHLVVINTVGSEAALLGRKKTNLITIILVKSFFFFQIWSNLLIWLRQNRTDFYFSGLFGSNMTCNRLNRLRILTCNAHLLVNSLYLVRCDACLHFRLRSGALETTGTRAKAAEMRFPLSVAQCCFTKQQEQNSIIHFSSGHDDSWTSPL